MIVSFSVQNGIGLWWAERMPLSIEYLVFATLFLTANVIEYGKTSFTYFSISAVFLFIIGTIYLLDNLYPYGQLTPLQLLVLLTTILVAKMLNFLGYQTLIKNYYKSLSRMDAYLDCLGSRRALKDCQFWYRLVMCWSGKSHNLYRHNLIISKNSKFSSMQKFAYFIFGAIVTYLINILRVTTIFVLGINYGINSSEVWKFHDFYGQLYSITWILSYPLIIIRSQALWKKQTSEKSYRKIFA